MAENYSYSPQHTEKLAVYINQNKFAPRLRNINRLSTYMTGGRSQCWAADMQDTHQQFLEATLYLSPDNRRAYGFV